jgi:integrase/recombinase XerD
MRYACDRDCAVEVRHVLSKSGTRFEEIGLAGSIAKGCRPRSIFLSHAKAIDAFDRYVEWRYRRGLAVALDRREYRGLMPGTRLVVTQKGGAFELSVKRRINVECELVEYLAADSLQTYVTDLYRRAGFGRGVSIHSGRRTFASRLVAQGQSLDTVQLLLGHAHVDHVAPYLEITSRERLDAVAVFDAVLAED